MRSIRLTAIFAVLLLLPGIDSMAQISEGGKPASFNKFALSNVQSVVTGPVNTAQLLEEDERDKEIGLPFRFGAPFDVNYHLLNSGTWDELADGSRIWRLRIESPGAYSINLIFDYFYLPPGAKMFVYSEDRKMILGAYTERNNKDHNKFSTSPVSGDVSIVEYYEPPGVRGEGVITIGRIVHGYKDIFNYGGDKIAGGFGSSGTCNNNVNCPEGDPWQDEKRSVVMILLSNGTRWCSGALVNNVRQDGTPYLLTANHCLGSEDTWVLWFNYESPTCENIDDSTIQSISGTTLISSSNTSDFGLVEISAVPPQSYNVYYAGWSNLDIASQSSVAIHHPSGDIKKISFDYDSVTSTDYLQPSGTTHWRIAYWDDGTTEGGSSGSPLFDHNHRIVGQLHGGYASCTNDTADWYGKFSTSWTGNGSPQTRLSDWLDPDGTGATTLNGWGPGAGLSIFHIPLENTYDTINDYEVACRINSNHELVPEELLLHYQIASVWYDVQLQPTGGTEEYNGFIPAQSAGTAIEYYLTASDTSGATGASGPYSFLVQFSPAISVHPGTFSVGLQIGDTTSRDLVIENSGNGDLDYSIEIDYSFEIDPLMPSIIEPGGLEPAKRLYPSEYSEYLPVKGVEDTRKGYDIDKDAGGPDDFGHYWIDSDDPGGPAYSWVDISATGTEVEPGDDGFVGPIAIGFDFPFYGNNFGQLYIGSNGLITFGMGSNAWANFMIPTQGTPENFIAPFWDDLDPPENGQVLYYNDVAGGRFIISFIDIRLYQTPNGTGSLTFQAILYPDGKIAFQYRKMDPGTHIDGLEGTTIGIENATGTDGLEIVFNAVYLHDSLAVEIYTPYQWLTVDEYSGTIPPGFSDTLNCLFSAAELDTGVYLAHIVVNSNDPDPLDNPISVPAQLKVISSPYLCGDANADGIVDVGDVVFIINYLYRGGAAPDPLCLGDVNGDDLTNLGDASYLVNYIFRESDPPIVPCCP